jgi:ubiquinone/menaquinone biosynthesis C-methylase UbiE
MGATAMDRNAKIWDRLADGYAKRPVANEAAYQKKLQVTQSYLRPDMEVLEFGCGTGSTAIVHSPFVKHILAIDISERMIAIANEKVAAKGISNITFKPGSIDDLLVTDSTLDVVMGHNILHLLKDKDATVAKVYRMLKPGGFFVSGTVCLGDNMKWKCVKLIAPIGRVLGLMPLVKVFSKSELLASITNAGFSIDYQWQQESKVTVAFIVAKKG